MSFISTKKRVLNIALSLGLFLTILGPVIPKASASTTTAAPRVTFTFDDGLTSAFTQAAPTLAKYGFKGVDFVTSSCIGSSGTCPAEPSHSYMDWAQVSVLNNTYGWEIAAHTVTHPLLASTDPVDQPTALTPDQVVSELTNSKSAILANTGINTTDFATPYGDWTFPVLAQIAKYNASHRGFGDSIDQGTADGIIDHSNVFPYNDYLLYDLPVQAGVTVAQVKSYIDQTINSGNQWLVLTFHDIQPVASTSPDDYEYSTADLDAIAAYVKSKNLQVVTINEGLVGGTTNLLPASSFDTALSTNTADPKVWSTDDGANIKQDTGNNGSFPSPANSVSLTGTTRNIQLYSPQVPVDSNQTYVIKGYLNSSAITVAAGHEIAYYVQEFDAAGTALTPLQYKKSETTVWIESMNFEYKPSSAAVKSARLYIVVTANSGVKAYVDNFQWFSETAGKAGDVNGDNTINALDLSIVASNWNRTGATRAQGDLSGDGKVNALDLSLIATNWGK